MAQLDLLFFKVEEDEDVLALAKSTKSLKSASSDLPFLEGVELSERFCVWSTKLSYDEELDPLPVF